MATPRSFKQINASSRELQLIQDNIERAISQVINCDLLNGRIVEAVDLASGDTKVEHKLGRAVRGYMIVDKNAPSTIYTVSKDEKFLTLNSSAACVASLWVF